VGGIANLIDVGIPAVPPRLPGHFARSVPPFSLACSTGLSANDLVGMVGMVVTRSEIEKHPRVVAGLCRALYESFFFAEGNIEATVRNHFKVYPRAASLEQAAG
jgi:hypothetical protein